MELNSPVVVLTLSTLIQHWLNDSWCVTLFCRMVRLLLLSLESNIVTLFAYTVHKVYIQEVVEICND